MQEATYAGEPGQTYRVFQGSLNQGAFWRPIQPFRRPIQPTDILVNFFITNEVTGPEELAPRHSPTRTGLAKANLGQGITCQPHTVSEGRVLSPHLYEVSHKEVEHVHVGTMYTHRHRRCSLPNATQSVCWHCDGN